MMFGGPAHLAVFLLALYLVTAQQLNQTAILEAHNSYRTSLTLEPLTWSQEAADVAQAYAINCTYAHNANRGMLGENIAAGTAIDVVDAVMLWGEEQENYICSNNTCAPNSVCGHYTQIVWNGTRAVGCGIADCTQNSPFGPDFPTWTFVVCDYSPPGNFIGQSPLAASQCPNQSTSSHEVQRKRIADLPTACNPSSRSLVPNIAPMCSFFFHP